MGEKSLLLKLFPVNFSNSAASQINLQMRAHLDVAWDLVRGDQRNYGKSFRFLFIKKILKELLLYILPTTSFGFVSTTGLQIKKTKLNPPKLCSLLD